MKSTRYLNTVLTAIAILLTLNLASTWSTTPDFKNPAFAQGIPDSGAQRYQIIDQLKLLNENTQRIEKLLTSGKVRVIVMNASDD